MAEKEGFARSDSDGIASLPSVTGCYQSLRTTSLQARPKGENKKAAHLVWTACVCDQYGVACHGGERGI